MNRWLNRVAVVTGAAMGIGEKIANDLLSSGFVVVGLDRCFERLAESRSRLSEERQNKFFVRKCDVSKGPEVRSAFEWIDKTMGGTDVLVNNAGIFYQGNLSEMDIALVDEVIDTNLKGVVYCSQEAFKSMKRRNFDGHILHINSISGHRVLRFNNMSLNVYSPTKYAMTAINETLRMEFLDLETKIKTTNVSTGAARTEIIPNKKFDPCGGLLNLEDISQAVLFAIATPPHVQIHEIIVKPIGEVL